MCRIKIIFKWRPNEKSEKSFTKNLYRILDDCIHAGAQQLRSGYTPATNCHFLRSGIMRAAKLIIALGLGLIPYNLVLANGDPSIAKLNIYGVAVSSGADCSNPKVIAYSPVPTTYDLLTNPAFLTGHISAGTYQCMVLIMDAGLTFTPATNVGAHCSSGTSYQRVLCTGTCQYQSFSIDAANNLTYSGAVNSGAADSSQWASRPQVLLFLSTGSTGNGNNAFKQPTIAANGLNLSSPFTVGATGASGTFVINFAGQVNDTGTDCDLGPPAFGFR
jgi:hypothetical protein